ncbi:MAG: thiolase family protein [Actinomycetota bacterium]|nr:thiolase family protein [Actinomycetota bacterium]
MPLPQTRQVAVVGTGMLPPRMWTGRSPLDMAAEALQLALDDAGLTHTDVDGLYTNVGTPLAADYDRMAEAYGLQLRSAVQTWTHGRFVGTAVQSAAMAVAMGLCEVAVCLAGVNFTRLGLVGGALDLEGLRQGGGSHGEAPQYGMTGPGAGAAMAFQKYCTRYDKDPDLIAAMPVAQRKHAQLNPLAQMGKPMDAAKYFTNPYIFEPLRRPDFALLSEGAGAIVITSLDRARDLAKPPVVIGGMQGLRAGRDEFIFAPPGLGVFSQSDDRRIEDNPVYAMAGVSGPTDVDALYIYDAFSPNIVFVAERFGFAGEGEGLDWIQDGRIELGGELPLNTHGGLLSEGHVCGWGHMVEMTRQVRGECGQRQVQGLEVAQFATPFGDSLIFHTDRR